MIGTKHTIQLKEYLADRYLPSDHPVGFWSQSGVQDLNMYPLDFRRCMYVYLIHVPPKI